MSPAQPYQRTVGTDGLAYMKARGRAPVNYIPTVPVLTKHSLLTRLHARNNGVIIPPVNPPPGGGGLGDGVAARDAALVPWYGKLGDAGSAYTLAGPTKDQVGVVDAYNLLPDLNPANTEDTTVTTTLTISNGKWHGRIKLSGQGKVIATNVIFDGPTTPGNTGLFSGETAIIDGNSAGVAQSHCKDCSFYMKVPHPRFNAHKGSRMKLERCHLFWVTDGIGPYTTPGSTFSTAFEMVACRIENLYYWPGPYFANRSPAYWNGTTYGTTTGAWTRTANGTASDRLGFFDDGHPDGNHSDCCEIHSGFGSHTFNPTSQTWAGDGIHIWGNSMICNDAYASGNPSNLIIPTPQLGYGDNPKRGLIAGGQLPGMARPQTSWNKQTSPGRWACNGSSMYVGHVVGPAFPSNTTVVIHDNYFAGGSIGMQEQRKTQPFIQFNFYDNHFGPDYYMWNSANTNDMYPVRLNDYSTANAMPDFVAGPVRIPRHPVTNAPVFGAGASNIWVGAQAKFGIADGTGVGLGSSSVPGIRVI